MTQTDLDHKLDKVEAFIKSGDEYSAYFLIEEIAPEHPEHVRVNILRSRAHHGVGNVAKSLKFVKRALNIAPNRTDLRFAYARGCYLMGWADEALEYLDGITGQLNPKMEHQILLKRGEILHRIGRLEEAEVVIKEFERRGTLGPLVIGLKASLEAANGNLEGARQHLESVIEDIRFPLPIRQQLSFELATVCDRMGQYDDAFAAVARTKEVLPSGVEPFNQDAYQEQTDLLIDYFTADRIATLTNSGVTDELPVFIVGLPRSGTSLIEQVIAAHPNAAGTGERREPIISTELLSKRNGVPFPTCLDQVGQADLTEDGTAYIEMLNEFNDSKDRITNKALGLERVLGYIQLMLPASRAIFVERNPLDNLLSIYLHPLPLDLYPWTYRLEDLAFVKREYDRLLDHWRAVLKIPTFDLKYEELTTDQEVVTQNLLSFLGLEFNESCIKFHQSNRAVLTPSFDQVNKPMNQNAVNRWRNYEHHIGVLIDAFGTTAS